MKFSFFIAKRYLFSRKKRNAINIITGISMFAFAGACFALVVIASAMNGLEGLILDIHNNLDPDYKVEATTGKVFEYDKGIIAKLEKIKGVIGATICLSENAVLKNGDRKTICYIKGVEKKFLELSGLKNRLINGELSFNTMDNPGVIVGAGVDYKLALELNNPYVVLNVFMPKRGDYNINDPDALMIQNCIPTGVISLDDEINNKLVISSLDFMKELLDRGNAVSTIEIFTENNVANSQLKAAIQKLLPENTSIKNRFEQQATIYNLFRTEKWATIIILAFILFIAAFNLVGALSMLIIEKKEDISTLKSMGANNHFIFRIFMLTGTSIAMLGSFIGIIIASALVLMQQKFGIFKMSGAVVDYFPVQLRLLDIVITLIISVLTGVTMSYFPSIKSAKIKAKLAE